MNHILPLETLFHVWISFPSQLCLKDFRNGRCCHNKVHIPAREVEGSSFDFSVFLAESATLAQEVSHPVPHGLVLHCNQFNTTKQGLEYYTIKPQYVEKERTEIESSSSHVWGTMMMIKLGQHFNIKKMHKVEKLTGRWYLDRIFVLYLHV